MAGKNSKLNSCSESQNQSLTIFDAPNVCRDQVAKCQPFKAHSDPAVVAFAQEMEATALKMLNAAVNSVDQLLALEG